MPKNQESFLLNTVDKIKESAQKNNKKKQKTLSLLHEIGFGVDQDVTQAEHWREKSQSNSKKKAPKTDMNSVTLEEKNLTSVLLQSLILDFPEVMIGDAPLQSIVNDGSKISFTNSDQDIYSLKYLCEAPVLTEINTWFTDAPFGDLKQKKTVIDKNVRTGQECENFTLSNNQGDIPDWLRSIQEQIRTIFTNNTQIEFQQYKLLKNNPGAFFDLHVDTPFDPVKMLGSLIIFLPRKITGGGVTFHTHSRDMILTNLDTKVTWAAFYGDVLHKLNHIIEVEQLILTYHIIESEKAVEPIPNALHQLALDHLQKDLSQVFNMYRPSKLYVTCKHWYTKGALKHMHLKGVDKIIFSFLRKLYDVTLAHYEDDTNHHDTCIVDIWPKQSQTVLKHIYIDEYVTGNGYEYHDADPTYIRSVFILQKNT